VGPLLIAKSTVDSRLSTVAIPGENTTAHLLFSLAYPNAKKKKFLVFNEIENAVLNETVDAGVIIHENRFTYFLKGLQKIVDLGEYWEQQLNVPIPLGGIVAKKSLDIKLIKQVDELIKQSVEYAFEHHHKNLAEYVQCHAQEMSEEVMRRHIDLYVNNYSIALGDDGKKAVLKLLEVYRQLHPEIKLSDENIFVS
jgi:1,4-dihydroxy-6-naphthoate synthase